jgi:hypothetical protein
MNRCNGVSNDQLHIFSGLKLDCIGDGESVLLDILLIQQTRHIHAHL